MEYISSVFSLLFFLLMFTYLYGGIHIIRLNRKSSLSKVFLLICISLSIWSFGFAMANTAQYVETSLFWRRVSAIGWTSIYTLMLHFLLLLANENASIKQKRMFILVHIPAIVNMYIFVFSNSMAVMQYNMVRVDYGWINRPVNNLWDFLFYFYYVTYIISSLIIVWKWEKGLSNKAITKRVKFFFIAIIGCLLLGSMTDVVWNSIFERPLPQMSPLFILLPTWAMYNLAIYHGLIRRQTLSKDEVIVTDEDQRNIFNNISIAFWVGGILTFVSEYMPFSDNGKGDLKSALLKGGLLIIIGLFIRIIQMIRRESVRDMFVTIVLLLSIPIVTFQFLEYSSITVWVFPIVIIISSLLFSKRTLLISSTIVAIVTQKLVWIFRPEAFVAVDGYDYILRIGMYIIVFSIGSYVNKVYVAKMNQNTYQVDLQKLNSEISLDFVTINQENFDKKVDGLLSKTGLFFQADRTYIFMINHENKTMTYSHEWCDKEVKSEVGSIEKIPLAVFPWWIDQLEENKLVYIEDVNIMPDEASAEQEQLIRQKVKSLVSVPIRGNSKIQGFIGIDSVVSFKKWSQEDIKFLNILSNLLASGLTKIKAEKEIEFMAYYDQLTLLPNRFMFADRVNQAINLSKRTGNFVSIMFIDLDSFKSVNDTMGHSSGDYLLVKVVQRLAKQIRKTDTVARFGGDEFMIMLNNITDYKDVLKIADNIMGIFLEPFIIDNQEFFITASAGIANYPIDGEDSETLIKNADISMYEAKFKGKNQYVLCTTDLKDEVKKNMLLSNDLYRAIERNELVVYYQPQIDLSTGDIVGLEALLRWIHPEFGMILPSVFIPLAEKNNLINIIGEWVLRTACTQNKRWQDMGSTNLSIAVNLSGIQFVNPKIAYNVENILKETGLNSKYLELEITESIAIKEANDALDVLNKLKKIGVSIAIDDFGTEYSSLSRLKVLPIDRIKIDMQFIQGIEINEKDKAITMIIINLAKSLGLKVLAEGVETNQQLEFLSRKNCDYVQGYYYYKPMTAEKIEKVLKTILKEEEVC